MAGRGKNWLVASRNQNLKCVSESFGTPDAVVIVPYHVETQKIVIIREFRVPLGDFQYGFPAGLLDAGESVEASARRELAEETGLTLTRIRRVSPPIYSSSGLTDESIVMVYGDCAGAPSRAGNSSSEDIETLFFSKAQAAALCADQRIKWDVKTWLVLSFFAETGAV